MNGKDKRPEVIVRDCRRRRLLKQGLMLLVMGAAFAWIFWQIWWRDAGLPVVLLSLLVYALAVFAVNVWISWDVLVLNLILNQDCDPVKFARVMRLLGERRNNRRNSLVLRISEAAGIFWSGRFSEARTLAESLPMPKEVRYRISLLNIRFNCCMKLGDHAGALALRREAEALTASLNKASMRKRGQELLDVMDASFALHGKDYETFRRLEEVRSAGYKANIQKVVSAAGLAEADIARGDIQNARKRLEYAIQNGGTLYVVEDARRMLAELEEKE